MTDVLTVHGGTPLTGTITVRGAKNFVSKAMVAALLGEEPSRLANVPQIRDVTVVTGLLELHGVQVTESSPAEGVLELDPSNVERAHVADIDAHAGASRIPVLFCGPLVHRLGSAFIPDLGGCPHRSRAPARQARDREVAAAGPASGGVGGGGPRQGRRGRPRHPG